MRMFESVSHSLKKYADFKGRASRSEFWNFFFFLLVAQFVARLVDALFFRMLFFSGPISGLTTLLLLVPQFSVAVRRLHDVNRSGRELLVPCVMLFLMPLVFMFGGGFLPRIVALGFAGVTLLMFANLLLLLSRKGSTVPNRYGASPTAFSFAG